MDRYVKAVSVAALASLLASCGGGSGDSSGSTTGTQYPLNAAVSAFSQMNNSYTLHATSGGNSYILQLAWAAGSQQTFMGHSAFTQTRTTTLFKNTTLINNDVEVGYFLLGPFEPLGGIDTNGQVTIDISQAALPAEATIGQSGAFQTQTTYTDNTLTTVYATDTVTWALNAATGSDASACLNYVGMISGSPYSESDCYTIDTSGNVLALTASVDVNGTILNFQ